MCQEIKQRGDIALVTVSEPNSGVLLGEQESVHALILKS